MNLHPIIGEGNTKEMTPSEARKWRQQMHIAQDRIATDLRIDAALLGRWERGTHKLRPEQVQAITAYLAQRWEEMRKLEFPTQVAL